MATDPGDHLHRLTTVYHALGMFRQLERLLREQHSLKQLLELLEHRRGPVRAAAAFCLGLIGDYSISNPLALRLHDADDSVPAVAEKALWSIWLRSGNPAIDARLREGLELIQQGRYAEAEAQCTRIMEDAPDFPEARNQRAIARFLNSDYEGSLEDCEWVVQSNPVHFGALAGMGHCYIHLGRKGRALRAYEHAFAVNPNMEQIELAIETLRQEIRGERTE